MNSRILHILQRTCQCPTDKDNRRNEIMPVWVHLHNRNSNDLEGSVAL